MLYKPVPHYFWPFDLYKLIVSVPFAGILLYYEFNHFYLTFHTVNIVWTSILFTGIMGAFLLIRYHRSEKSWPDISFIFLIGLLMILLSVVFIEKTNRKYARTAVEWTAFQVTFMKSIPYRGYQISIQNDHLSKTMVLQGDKVHNLEINSLVLIPTYKGLWGYTVMESLEFRVLP